MSTQSDRAYGTSGLQVLDFKVATSVSEDFISSVEKLGGSADLIAALRVAT